jgi:adenosylcobinamide-phosphate synthase
MVDMLSPLVVMLAFFLDLIAGDPQWSFHPIRIIGKLIVFFERCLPKLFRNKLSEKKIGLLLCLGVISIVYAGTYCIVYGAYLLNVYCGLLVYILLVYFTISLKALGDAALRIQKSIADGNDNDARLHLAQIVGRDTGKLNREEIVRATVETVAENTSDGIIAPLFYLMVGGAPLAMTYKAVNTLDSMVGYKNEKYIHLGWASARCDDLVNYLPARITGFLLFLSALLYQKDWKNSWVTMKRDARKHLSPNSGYPEAAVAGALNVRLGGTNFYGGIPRTSPLIGMQKKVLNASSIGDVVRMMYCASFIMLIVCLLILWRTA